VALASRKPGFGLKVWHCPSFRGNCTIDAQFMIKIISGSKAHGMQYSTEIIARKHKNHRKCPYVIIKYLCSILQRKKKYEKLIGKSTFEQDTTNNFTKFDSATIYCYVTCMQY